MSTQMPWWKSLGARLGLLSLAILVSAILLIVADFRMLGEIDAAKAQTNTLGHDRGDAYQLLALTERLAREAGEHRARTLGEVGEVSGRISRRLESLREGQSRQALWHAQMVPALDRLAARPTPPSFGGP